MSRKWTITCTVCVDSTKEKHLDPAVLDLGEDSNHNEDGAVAIARASKALAVLGKAAVEAEVQLAGLCVPAGWFAQHDGHKLAVVSAYGELSDEYWPEEPPEISRAAAGATDVFRCQSAKAFRGQGIEQCGLPENHEGSHRSGFRTWEGSDGVVPLRGWRTSDAG